MKYFLLILVMLSSVSCCSLNKFHIKIFGYISSYTDGRPISKEKFQEAMMLLYNKYPEIRVTREIIIEYENSIIVKNGYFDYPRLSDSVDCELKFFGGKKIINVKTSTDNFIRISASWPLFEENNFVLYLEFAFFKKYKYVFMYADQLTCQELKEAQREFETEILPKIRECIEIVKKKHEQNGNKNE